MRLIDADKLKIEMMKAFDCENATKYGNKNAEQQAHSYSTLMLYEISNVVEDCIDNAPTVEEKDEPFITKCRDTAIKENLPLYFVYYEETGVFEVYITETKELFEKRHCSKHLSNYVFKEIVTYYLDNYSEWKKEET